MSLNKNKSDGILLLLDLKVFSINTIRDQERENMKNIGTQSNKCISKLLPMVMKTFKKLPLMTQGDPRTCGLRYDLRGLDLRGFARPKNVVIWHLYFISHYLPFY